MLIKSLKKEMGLLGPDCRIADPLIRNSGGRAEGPVFLYIPIFPGIRIAVKLGLEA